MIASLALPLLLSLAPFADAGLIAYKDSKCTQRQKIISKGKDIAELSTDISITAQGAGRYYKDMQFPSADTLGPTKGQGSNIVYWKVPKPDNGCTIALMHDRKRTSMAATKLPGDVFLLARDEGCFFSSLNEMDDIITTFCCGKGDCERLDLDTGVLTMGQRRSIDAPESRLPLDPPPVDPRKRMAAPLLGGTLAPIIEQVALKKHGECEVTETIDNKRYTTAGPQTAVSNPQTCSGPTACQFTVTINTQFSTTMSTTNSTITNLELGLETGYSAGVYFFGEFEVTGGFHGNIGRGWEKAKGKSLTSTSWTGETQTVTQQVGTTAFLSFTPLYECNVYKADCKYQAGTYTVDDFDICEPMKNEGSDMVRGEYTMVYL